MEILDIVAAVVFVGCLVLLGLVWRRTLLRRRGATVDLCVRRPGTGHGWALGVGRFAGDELEWFRIFSARLRPQRTFPRAALSVVDRRRAATSELLALMAAAVVVACEAPGGPVELAMTESAVTGFLAWLESAPPGATLPSLRD